MRQQSGYIFHRGPSWFLRYFDNVLENGVVVRKQVCKILPVPYGGQYRTRASVRPFAQAILTPVNTGAINPQSTMTLAEFVEKVYCPWAEKNLRECTVSGYKQIWNCYLNARVGKVALRDFRTVTGERLLQDLEQQHRLGKRTLQHHKAFLSGLFVQASRLGILDERNPMKGVGIPRTATQPSETYAYSLSEVNTMLLALSDKPMARTVVMLAALTGMRKSEMRGLRWRDFTGTELSVQRSVWRKVVSGTKTEKSKAAVPCVRMLADALNALRESMGILAQPDSPIFQAGHGKPLCFDNLARKTIVPALKGTPVQWQGWHAFRRGCATVLHSMHIDDVTIQRILRHSSVAITQAAYIKSLSEAQVSAMNTLEKALQATISDANAQNEPVCNNVATQPSRFVN